MSIEVIMGRKEVLSFSETRFPISYSGTVTGKLIKIEGAEAHKFIRGYYTD